MLLPKECVLSNIFVMLLSNIAQDKSISGKQKVFSIKKMDQLIYCCDVKHFSLKK